MANVILLVVVGCTGTLEEAIVLCRLAPSFLSPLSIMYHIVVRKSSGVNNNRTMLADSSCCTLHFTSLPVASWYQRRAGIININLQVQVSHFRLPLSIRPKDSHEGHDMCEECGWLLLPSVIVLAAVVASSCQWCHSMIQVFEGAAIDAYSTYSTSWFWY